MTKLNMETPDLTARNIDKIAALFPNCITETRDENGKLKKAVNFDLLRQMLSSDELEGDEAYEFTWVGKKAAIVEANRPIRKTLRPCPEESVNWDTTENLYIEGDNLEVLKLLQESYLGKIKLIYIDPPYNTGNDFIYRDNFAMSRDEWSEEIGETDEEGNRLFRNTDSNGRFHSDWCSMMYSRLLLARNLLSDDGAIFISIDDHEADNLKKICDEVFGAECFVGNISWQRTYSMRNDSKGIPSEVEHILVFSAQMNWLPHPLPRTAEMDSKYKNPDNDPNGKWQNTSAFAPGGASHQGMVYAIQHPFSGDLLYPTKDAHWRYQQDVMLEIMNGWTSYELREIDDAKQRAEVCGISANEIRTGVKAILLSQPLEKAKKEAENVMMRGNWPRFYFTSNGKGGIRRKTYLENVGGKPATNFWPYSEVGHTDEAKKELLSLFDRKAPFDTPKPVRLMKRILTIATDEDSIVMDFFSGSASMAHAVMKKNAEDGGHRKFIMVQIPEKSPSPSFDTLCDIGKDRIRRAGEEIRKGWLTIIDVDKSAPMEQISLQDGRVAYKPPYTVKPGKTEDDLRDLDIGFRVLKLDESNMNDVYFAARDYTQDQLFLFEDNIKSDRTGLDLLFGCLIDWGLPLSMPCKAEQIDGCTVYTYGSGDGVIAKDDLIACFDESIPDSVIKAIAKRQPIRAVFRDSSFADSPAKINLGELFKLLAPDTRVKVI